MGLIRNSKLVSQTIDFTGVQAGKIHPSDIDVVFEFNNELLILQEVKRRYNKIPIGQEMMLTRIADAWQEVRKAGVVLKIEHEHKDENTDIPLKDCFVTGRYYNKQWRFYDYGTEEYISFINKLGVYFENKKCKF